MDVRKILFGFCTGAILLLPVLAMAFSDVPAGHPYFADAAYLQEKGIVSGETFSPDKQISKREFIKWLLLDLGFGEEDYEIQTAKRFLDVPLGSEDAEFIYSLFENGGFPFPKDGIFYPEKEIRRIEALRFTFFMKGVPSPRIFPKNQFPFANLSPASYFAHDLYRAFLLGMAGPGNYYPYGKLTRGEAARFLKNAVPGNVLTIITLPGESTNTATEREIIGEEKFALFENAWQRIHNRFIRANTLSNDQLIYGAIEGLVKALEDPHSEFSPPQDNTITETLSGSVEGIGAVIEANEEKQIVIVAPIKGSPAEKAGLYPLDVIVEVDGFKTTGFTLNEVAAKIRGEAGTTVHLKILRDGTKTLDFDIVRAKISVPSVTISFTPDNIAVMTISNFSQTTSVEFLKAVAEISNKNPKGLVVDLRNNPGGFLDTSTLIAGYFISSGKTIVKVKYPERMEIISSSGTGILAKYPLRILVNKGSASASEILAGALRDHGLGKIIGEKTYGKGTVQELTSFADGSSLKITIAEWLTPLDHVIQENGITPDIVVARTTDDIRAGKDPQLDMALIDLR